MKNNHADSANTYFISWRFIFFDAIYSPSLISVCSLPCSKLSNRSIGLWRIYDCRRGPRSVIFLCLFRVPFRDVPCPSPAKRIRDSDHSLYPGLLVRRTSIRKIPYKMQSPTDRHDEHKKKRRSTADGPYMESTSVRLLHFFGKRKIDHL